LQPIARRSLRAKYDDALAMCRKAIELAPHYPPARWFMGLVYQQRKEHRPAIAAFQNAVRSHAPAGYSSRVAISVAQPVSMRLLLASKCSTSALAANLVPA